VFSVSCVSLLASWFSFSTSCVNGFLVLGSGRRGNGRHAFGTSEIEMHNALQYTIYFY